MKATISYGFIHSRSEGSNQLLSVLDEGKVADILSRELRVSPEEVRRAFMVVRDEVKAYIRRS